MTTYTDADIAYYEDRIRCAYRQLARFPNGWVSIASLRDHVGGYRELVDAALVKLSQAADVNIAHENDVPEPYQKTVTDWDRKCPIRIGGQDKHLIAITAG